MLSKKMVAVYPIRYIDKKLQYLLIRRATLSYNWQCVTGSVGHSLGRLDHPIFETPLQAAKRELFEETGYTPAAIIKYEPPSEFYVKTKEEKKELEEHVSLEFQKEIKEIKITNFIARIVQTEEPKLNPSEHTEWKWCYFKEAHESLMWAVEKKAIKYVNDYLRKNPLR